jgi:GNAT superfamily N-acetyltransferase
MIGMELLIRQAVVQDAETIHQLFWERMNESNKSAAASYNTAAHKSDLKRTLEEVLEQYNSRIFLAFLNEELVGLVRVSLRDEESSVIPFAWSDKHAFIDIISVKKAYRKKGIGKALMERAQDWASYRGCITIKLALVEQNKSVLGFYEQLGYKTEKIILSKELE